MVTNMVITFSSSAAYLRYQENVSFARLFIDKLQKKKQTCVKIMCCTEMFRNGYPLIFDIKHLIRDSVTQLKIKPLVFSKIQ